MEEEVEPQPSTRVGSLLRNHRLRARLDLAEVAQRSRIRQPFLEAIENGRFEALPAPVYALGFVRSYAELLGLDAEEIVRCFKSEVANTDGGAPLHFPSPIAAEAGTPKGAVLLLGVVIAIGAYAAWYLTSSHRIEMAEIVSPVPERLEHLLNGEAAAPAGSSTPVDRTVAPNSPSKVPAATHSVWTHETQIAISSAGGGSGAEGAGPGATEPVLPLSASVPSPGDTATRDETAPFGKVVGPLETASAPGGQTGRQSGVTAMAAEPPDGISPLASDGAGRIVLKAKADSWVEVRDPESNATLVARLLKTGDVYRIPDKRGLKLLTGNAGGLVVMVDGQLAPPLGKDGAVRRGVELKPESLLKGREGSSPQ
jgi:cytoskeleton protein RodZ